MELPPLSIVVIGRNEGERLARCLESVRAADYPREQLELLYVDSNSTDGSRELARNLGAQVIAITTGPLSAARARNLGWRQARCGLVHFVDGDCILNSAWLRKAVARIQEPGIGCVFGRLEELRPRDSIYMRVCSLDWHIPAGPWRICGGNALFRRDVLARLEGFREDLPAGEEPELSYRLRRAGLQIWRLDEPMVKHDLDMTRFRQYWQRLVRSGWAYAVVAARCWRGRERLWLRENAVNAAEVGVWFTLLAASLVSRTPWGALLAVALILSRAAWIAAKVRSRSETNSNALLYGLHCQFSRLPFFVGQLKGAWFILCGQKRQTLSPQISREALPAANPAPAGSK